MRYKFSVYFLYLFAISSALSISLTNIMIGILIIVFLLNIKKSLKKFPKDFLFFIFYYFWEIISNILNKTFSLKSLDNIFDKLPYSLASLLNVEKLDIEKFLKVLFTVNVFVIFHAILIMYFNFPFVRNLFENDHMIGYFGNHLQYAGYISLVLIISITLAIFHSSKYIITTLLLMVGLVLSYSRTYWISFIFVVIILLFLIRYTEENLSKKLLKGFFLVLLVIYFILPSVKDRIGESFIESYNGYSHLDLRINFWNACIDIVSKNPIYGVGEISGYLITYYEKGLVDNTSHCHNVYLTIFAEKGFIGFLIFISLSIYFMIKYFRIFIKSEDKLLASFSLAVFLGWIDLLISGFFESNFSTFAIWGFFSFWMGLVYQLYKKQKFNN